MRIDRKKALTLFALTLLMTSFILANMNVGTGYVEPEPIYLHGPSLGPVHMHSTDPLVPIHMNSNMTLTPVHMHYIGDPDVDPIYEPVCTPWHELYPVFCEKWHLSDLVDTDGDGKLSPNDQIEMTDTDENVTWYHVDRITWTMLLTNVTDPEDIMYVEFKGPPEAEDPINFPVCTYWHEVYPSYCNVYHITWASGSLEWCTNIDMENVTGDGLITTWHVEEVVTDLILREKIMDPICTWWHEIYPDYCKWWHLTSWEDNGDGMLSPSDQIDMIDEETGNKTWYHVDRVTITLNVSKELYPEEWMKIELKTYYFEEMYNALKHPVDTRWHEVYPNYCNVYSLTWWDWMKDDNCNGVLDVCDYIWLYNETSGIEERYHVDDICYDIILNKKIMDPICTSWHEIYPNFCNYHHLTSWEEDFKDPYPGRLSPCDQIDMYNETSEETKWYHVDRVTLTLYVTDNETGELYYLEYKGPFEDLYRVKTDPFYTYWHVVWPYYDLYGEPFEIDDWIDNCNGVLDHCDYISIWGGWWFHVEEVAIDIILNEKITDPYCTYWREIPPGYWEIPPEYWDEYHIIGWEDNDDGLLSPCDQVYMTLQPDGPTKEYHVEYVTLTLNITEADYPEYWYLIEYLYEGPVETMYWAKTHPIGTWWYESGYPSGENFPIEDWWDNCNGVLDYCDYITFDPEGEYWYHIEDVAIDMVVTEKIHDVAVTAVSSLYPWVYQGAIDPISVTVTNYGDYTETVDVYAYYDGTQAAPKQTVVLNPGNTQILTFDWDTTGVPPGAYTISAIASIAVDDFPDNNEFIDGTQEVREWPLPPEDLELYPREVVDLGDPTGTQWHQLHPEKFHYYLLTEWEPGSVLSPDDLIYMEEMGTGMPMTFEVDDVTIDIEVVDVEFGTRYWLDYECGYWTFDPKEPTRTKWNEIKSDYGPPEWPRCWHLIDWEDGGDGKLSYCDLILMAPNDPFPGEPMWFHVERVTVTLKLTIEGAMTPVQYYLEFMGTLDEFKTWDLIHYPWETPWHEILPMQGREWYLWDWADRPFLSPSDNIVLTLKDAFHEPIAGTEAEYHVDKLTVAMNITNIEMPEMWHIVKFEGSLQQFKKYHWYMEPWPGPIGTQWHEVNPTYCRQWYLYDWEDNGDWYLGHCDLILMVDKETGEYGEFHVESLSTDIYVSPLGVHDVAVTDAETFKTVCETTYSPINIVYENCSVKINATVENQGDFDETFDVTAKYDGTTIQTIVDVSLAAHTSTNVIFTWDTTGVAKGTYTISVEAEVVDGETETGDNTHIDGTVTVTWLGDTDGDFDVDQFDFWHFCDAFIDYYKIHVKDPLCDFDDDCDIDQFDFWAFCDGFIDYYKP